MSGFKQCTLDALSLQKFVQLEKPNLTSQHSIPIPSFLYIYINTLSLLVKEDVEQRKTEAHDYTHTSPLNKCIDYVLEGAHFFYHSLTKSLG